MMKRHQRHTGRILLWILSFLVVLSMVLGLILSVMPRPTPSPPILFAVCGDNLDNLRIYSRILKRVADDGNLFLIHTGNLVSNGSGGEYEEFLESMADFPLPFYPIPGNRDYYQGTPENFLYYTGAPDVHYSFDYGPVHFTLANSGLGDMALGELAWLRADLAVTRQPVKMVFLHYPPFDPAGSTGVMRSGNEEFMALMEEQGVDYVFAGHIHAYDAEERNGVHYIVTGGAGAPLDQDPMEGGFYHYVRVTVRDAEVTVETVPVKE